MKIYISTPVNARPEKTFKEKYKAATFRVHEIINQILAVVPWKDDLEFHSFIDAAPIGRHYSEPKAMGRCIQSVLECDWLILDDSCPHADFAQSKGCRAELYVARLYGKQIDLLSDYLSFRCRAWEDINVGK